MRFRFGSDRRCCAAVGVLLAAVGVASASCGKKGPPLAPLEVLPDRMLDLAAKRLGDTIYVRFTVPAKNIDGTMPADLDRVEVYAYTALDATEGRDLKRTRIIATIPVNDPPKPVEAGEEAPPPPKEPREPGVEQGQIIAISEVLSDELRVPLPPDPKAPKVKPLVVNKSEFALPLGMLEPKPEVARFYVAVGFSHKNKRGGLSPRPPVLLGEAPPPPPMPLATVTESAVVLTWKRPPTLRRPYLDPVAAAYREALVFGWFVRLPTPARLASTLKGVPAQPAITYNVYSVPDPDAPPSSEVPMPPPEAGPPVPGVVTMPLPLGEKPVEALTYSDPKPQWGARRCYVVRTVQTVETAVVESDPSPVACVTPEDVFPPSAPANLAAVASQGAVSLIWERVTSADLAGYLVLRGEAPDGPLEPLFDVPIRETTYRDASAKPGVRYVYEVVAVDTATTPNRSLPSNRVTEAAR